MFLTHSDIKSHDRSNINTKSNTNTNSNTNTKSNISTNSDIDYQVIEQNDQILVSEPKTNLKIKNALNENLLIDVDIDQPQINQAPSISENLSKPTFIDKLRGLCMLVKHYFIHFYMITVFEIFFFFFYVGPFSKNSVVKISSDLVDSLVNTTYYPMIKNIVDSTNTTNCIGISTQMDSFNDNLFHKMLYYIGISSGVLFMILFIDIIRYCVRSANPTNPANLTNKSDNNFSWIELIKTTIFMSFISLFEYLFFTKIVSYYQISSSDNFICNLFNAIRKKK